MITIDVPFRIDELTLDGGEVPAGVGGVDAGVERAAEVVRCHQARQRQRHLAVQRRRQRAACEGAG